MTEAACDLVSAQREFLFRDVPPVIGHRGAALDAPENTLASIREAKRQGARWVEVDVKISGDRQAYLLHDDTLDRTTDGSGEAIGKTFAELGALDAGLWFSNRFNSEPIPLLRSLFGLLIEEDMAVNLEIKPNPGEASATVEAVLEEIERSWPVLRPKPLLSSFNIEALQAACRLAPMIPRGLLVEAPGDGTLPLMAELSCASLHVDAEYCEAGWLRDMSSRRIPVLCYTVNDPVKGLRLLDQGAHSIITDRPKSLIQALLDAQ